MRSSKMPPPSPLLLRSNSPSLPSEIISLLRLRLFLPRSSLHRSLANPHLVVLQPASLHPGEHRQQQLLSPPSPLHQRFPPLLSLLSLAPLNDISPSLMRIPAWSRSGGEIPSPHSALEPERQKR